MFLIRLGALIVLAISGVPHEAAARLAPVPIEGDVARRFKAPGRNVHLIGFVRHKGLLLPRWSRSNRLTSPRRHVPGWLAGRTVRHIELAPQALPGLRFEGQTGDYLALPPQLRDLLEDGQALVTCKPGARHGKYSLLMPVIDDLGGASGVVLEDGALVLGQDPNGKEFHLELKLMGSCDGGYEYDNETVVWPIRGGRTRGYALKEYANLVDESRNNPRFADGDAVPAAAVLSFDGPKGKQGYLLRWSPGSIRASYQGNDGLQEPSRDTVLRSMGRIWGSLFARGLNVYSHWENLIINSQGSSDFVLTDHADLSPVGLLSAFDDPWLAQTRILNALSAPAEIPGVDKRGELLFRNELVQGLEDSSTLHPAVLEALWAARNHTELAERLAQDVLMPQSYRQRRDRGWIPPAMIRYAQRGPALAHPLTTLAKIEDHLGRQIAQLSALELRTQGNEQAELRLNLAIARHRRQLVDALDEQTLQDTLRIDHLFVTRLYLLPYHTKCFDWGLHVADFPEYQMLSDLAVELHRSGKLHD